MLSLKDCLDFCDLDCSGIEAIAEHEHIPVIVAAELSNELLKTPEGIGCLHEMALDNLNQAMAQGDWEKRCVQTGIPAPAGDLSTPHSVATTR